MEPTGIEPVTSCLQNDTADLPYGPIFLRLCEIATLAPRRGYGGIRRDYAGFGQRNRAAAQTFGAVVARCVVDPSLSGGIPAMAVATGQRAASMLT
jgi:hypothetical protein